MKTKTVEVRTSRTTALCETCSEELEYTGQTLLSSPPQYVYRCPKCGKEERLKDCYPRYDFRGPDES